MKGKRIKWGRTLKSWYDNNSVEVVDNRKNKYRVHINEIVEMMKTFDFDVEKKRVHSYLKPKV